jgi:hypothetical protein
MCFGLVVLAPRGEVSGSSKTPGGGCVGALDSGPDAGRALLSVNTGREDSPGAANGENGENGVESARARLLEASALAESDF